MGERAVQFCFPPDRAAPVDRAAPSDGDVVQALPSDQRRVGVLMSPLPTTIDDGVVSRILTAQHDCARVKIERNIVSQGQASREIPARRQIDGPASAGGAGIDRGLDGGRVQGLAVADRAIAAHIEPGGNFKGHKTISPFA